MKTVRYFVARWLVDLGARIYPLSVKSVGYAHYVGDRWLAWTIEKEVQP